ncbi:N-terminal fungal transcription regulatory domain-containing protein, partial [Colletotrichum tofieldiae]
LPSCRLSIERWWMLSLQDNPVCTPPEPVDNAPRSSLYACHSRTCMINRQCYREIRPAVDSSSSDVTTTTPDMGRKRSIEAASDQSQHQSLSNRKPKRRNVLVACESCKKRKVKCSADRPKCSSCTTRGVECRYSADPSESRVASLKRRHDEMASRNDSLQRFFSAMRSMPEGQAQETLKRIRSGASAEDIVFEIEAGCLLVKLASRRDVETHEPEPNEAEVKRPASSKAKGFDISWAYPSWAHRPSMNVT